MSDPHSKSTSYKGFTFRLGDEDWKYRTSKVLSYYDVPSLQWKPDEAQRMTAHFRGGLLTLFGPPQHSSSLSDEAIHYCIEAVDPSGTVWPLTAYEGPSGSAIGAEIFHHSEAIPIAELLRELIQETRPSDFRATVYDEDTDNTVEYGVASGEYFYQEQRGNHLRSGQS
jgi:hypothetical protein